MIGRLFARMTTATHFRFGSGMTEEEARQLQDVLTRRGHKQLYEFRRSKSGVSPPAPAPKPT
jgi:hypothetical protein